MKYSRPELLSSMSALTAVQNTDLTKGIGLFADSDCPEFQPNLLPIPAYETDE
jgi:hypothetical protein